MIFRYPRLNVDFKIQDNTINCLVIENPAILSEVIYDLYEQKQGESGTINIYDNDKPLKLKNEVGLITGPFDVNFIDLSLRKKLYNLLDERMNDINGHEILTNINSQLISLIDDLSVNDNLNIENGSLLDFKDVFSALKIDFIKPSGTFIERLIDYLDVYGSIASYRLFIVMLCEGLLSSSDCYYLDEYVKYKNVKIMFISSHFPVLHFCLNKLIIDNDLCEI